MVDERNNETVSVGEWFLSLVVASIPVIGFIAVLLWAFGKGAAVSKRNWAQAMVIMYLIGGAISILFWSSFVAVLGAMFFGAS